MFCHQYPIGGCVIGNDEVLRLHNNIASSMWTATESKRTGCDCQHQGGRELGSNGRVNICESLINVVRGDKPKVLTCLTRVHRLGPKRQVVRLEASKSSTADGAPPANRRDLTHSVVLP